MARALAPRGGSVRWAVLKCENGGGHIKWTQGDGTVVQKWVPKRCLRHPISKNGLVGPYEKKLEEAKKRNKNIKRKS